MVLNFFPIIPFTIYILIAFLLLFIEILSIKLSDLDILRKSLLEGENSFKNKLETKINDLSKEINRIQTLDKNISNHPIYTTQNDFKPVIENLFRLTSTQNQAIKFSKESLMEITKRGFVKIDISFEEYTNLLCELTKTSKSNIIGTYTVRPKKLEENVEEKSKLVLTDYINELSGAKNRGVSIRRYMVFELAEIVEILKNHNQSSNTKINELEKFKSEIPSSKTLWSSTTLFLSNLEENDLNNVIAPHQIDKFMTDFAIFDNELLVLWRENNNKHFRIDERTGTLLVNWNNRVKELSEKLNTSLNFTYNTFKELTEKLSLLSGDKRKELFIDEEEYQEFQTAFKAYINKDNELKD